MPRLAWTWTSQRVYRPQEFQSIARWGISLVQAGYTSKTHPGDARERNQCIGETVKQSPQNSNSMSMGRRGARQRLRVGVSPIHGRGIFARRRIREAAYVATFIGRETKTNGMHVLWTLDEEGREVGIEGQNDLRFLNHSHDPNVEFIGADLYAISNIQPGVELTLDYGDDWEDIE
jgi:SET domain-containing protein